MAQNTARETFGPLTIKYSPLYSQFDADARLKLVCSFDLAKRAVRDALAVLDAIQSQPDLNMGTLVSTQHPVTGAALGAVPYQILRFHFKLPHDRGGWRLDILRITNNLRQIHLGLSKPVVIADAHATLVGREVRAHFARFPAEEQDFELNKMLNPHLPEGELWGSWLERNQSAKKAVHTGFVESLQAAGFVAPKKAVVRAVPEADRAKVFGKDRSAHLTADAKGSMHLNFWSLLLDKRIKNASVAHTIIHEAAHKFCDARDFAYAKDLDYFQMTKAQAIMNADSYGLGAVSLYYKRLLTSDDDLLSATGINANA
jgi:hypothetical protein